MVISKTLMDKWSSGSETWDNVICADCIHYRGGFPPKCIAFPKRIPKEIYNDGFDHSKPFKGDQGVRYEKIKKT